MKFIILNRKKNGQKLSFKRKRNICPNEIKWISKKKELTLLEYQFKLNELDRKNELEKFKAEQEDRKNELEKFKAEQEEKKLKMQKVLNEAEENVQKKYQKQMKKLLK